MLHYLFYLCYLKLNPSKVKAIFRCVPIVDQDHIVLCHSLVPFSGGMRVGGIPSILVSFDRATFLCND